jgi:hypothetical protein
MAESSLGGMVGNGDEKPNWRLWLTQRRSLRL